MPDTAQTPYREKLFAPWWMWLVVAGISFALGLALSPTNVVLCCILIAAGLIIGVILVTASTPTVMVTDTLLRVGRASIPREYLGEVTGHRGEDARYERGRGLNGLAFMCFRGWIDPVVKVVIEDPRDTTPYWLFSSRHPEALVAALGGRMVEGAAGHDITESSEPSALQRDGGDTDGGMDTGADGTNGTRAAG